MTGTRTLKTWTSPLAPPVLEEDLTVLPDGITAPQHARMLHEQGFCGAAEFFVDDRPSDGILFTTGQTRSTLRVLYPVCIVAEFNYNHPKLKP